MSIRANVASKYRIEFGSNFFINDFERMLAELEDKYPELVCWHDENYDTMELSKLELEKAKDDKELSDELRGFAEDLLESSDPEYEDVHVEMF